MQEVPRNGKHSIQADDASHFFLGKDSVLPGLSTSLIDMASASAYALASADFLSTMLAERSEPLGVNNEKSQGEGQFSCWSPINLSSAAGYSPWAHLEQAGGNRYCSERNQRDSSPLDTEQLRRFIPDGECPMPWNSAIAVHYPYHARVAEEDSQEDCEALCLTSKYIVLEESIPDTVNSSVTESSDGDATNHKDDSDDDDDESMYEFFEDVSVLTADSGMEEIDASPHESHEDGDSILAKIHLNVDIDSTSDLSIHNTKWDHSHANATQYAAISPKEDNVAVVALEDRLLLKSTSESCTSIANPTQDFLLMSYLLNFCDDVPTKKRG